MSINRIHSTFIVSANTSYEHKVLCLTFLGEENLTPLNPLSYNISDLGYYPKSPLGCEFLRIFAKFACVKFKLDSHLAL